LAFANEAMASPSCHSCSASSRPVVIEAEMVAPLIAFRGIAALS
jgi:hypothetical protein